MNKEIKIPEDWNWEKLGDICRTTSGGTPNRGNKNYYNGDIPWVKSGELDKGLILDTEEKITHDALKNSSAKVFPKGTLLIALYGATIGKLAFLGVDAATNQAICGIYQNEKIDPQFLFKYLLSKKQELVNKGVGGAQPNISQTILKQLEIPLPPLKIQQLIISKIEELFSELDKGIEYLKASQQQLIIYRHSVLKYAFEGFLTNTNVKEGELPKGWTWTTMDKVCVKIGDIDHKMPKQLSSGYPYVSTKDFTDDLKISFDNAKYISKEDYLNLSRKIKPERGDIIFPRYGTIGKNILIDFDKKFLVSYSCAVIKPNKELVLSKFLYLYSLSPKITEEIRKYVVETTQANIGIASIKSFLFPLPSILEQAKVVQEIENRLNVADKMEESIKDSLQQAETLRQSILKQAFEGKLVIDKPIEISKPKNIYFHQMQVLGMIAKASKAKQIWHGEMTLAKYTYLVDRIYNIPTHYEFERLHLGPYPIAMKKAINKEYFKIVNYNIDVVNEQKLFKYKNSFKEQLINAVNDLADIFSQFKPKDRAHKTELLATVCKVIEDIKSTDIKKVRESMKQWKVNLKTSSFKNKAEKFSEFDTKKCLEFIIENGWDKKLYKYK